VLPDRSLTWDPFRPLSAEFWLTGMETVLTGLTAVAGRWAFPGEPLPDLTTVRDRRERL